MGCYGSEKEDVAKLLTVSVKTIDKLIETEQIPVYVLGGEYRFNRMEIENWILKVLSEERNILPFGEENETCSPWQQFGLYRAIHMGGVLSNVGGSTKEEIIGLSMNMVHEKVSFDSEVVKEMLIDRERLMPTSLGNGIAVPHTREFLLHGLFDVVVVVYLTNPVDWGSLDGRSVHTLFFMFACDDKRHLNLLAKIAHLSSSRDAISFLQTRPGKAELLEYTKCWSQKSPSQCPPQPLFRL